MRLKIGTRNYKVIFPDAVLKDGDATYTGLIDYLDETIYVTSAQTRNNERETMMHEVVHAIFRNAGIQNHDENIIDAVGNGMVEVLRRNADLVKYLLEGSNKEFKWATKPKTVVSGSATKPAHSVTRKTPSPATTSSPSNPSTALRNSTSAAQTSTTTITGVKASP